MTIDKATGEFTVTETESHSKTDSKVRTIVKYLDDKGFEHLTELKALQANEEHKIHRHLVKYMGWDSREADRFVIALTGVNPTALEPVQQFLDMCKALAQDRIDRSTKALERVLKQAAQLP